MARSTKRRYWRLRLIRKYGQVCLFCKGHFPQSALTLEHVVPISRGGSYGALENHALACSKCNNEKGGLTAYEFAVYLGLAPEHFGVLGALAAGKRLLPPLDQRDRERLSQMRGTFSGESQEYALLRK